MSKEEFLNLLKNKRGNIQSSRLAEDYLKKNNLYEFLLANTSFLDEKYSILERVVALRDGYTEIPVCQTCGKLSTLKREETYKFKKFCSTTCNTEFSEKIKAHRKIQDHTISNRKREQTLLAKYGVAFNSQRSEVKDIISKSMRERQIPKDAIQKLDDKEWLDYNYNTLKRSAVDLGKELNVFYGTVLGYFRKYGYDIRSNSNYSLGQREIFEYVKTLGFQPIENYSPFSDSKKELDIFIPEKNIAIEYNGLYWHSSDFVDENIRRKHIQKTEMCDDLGIHLMQFFSDEWETKQNIVKSVIASKLEVYERRFYARKCKIQSVNPKEAKKFLEDNHLQGYFACDYKGLYENNELLAIMGIGKSRFKTDENELIRYASKIHTQVIGGFSKLLKSYNISKVVSYADRRYSKGDVYGNFTSIKTKTNPSFFYTDGNVRYSRFKFQKYKLEKILNVYDPNKSATENVLSNGYRIIFDCGCLRYEIRI